MATGQAIAIEPVTSSNLSGYGYDPDAQVAAVQFSNGHIFHYAAVPVKVWDAWQGAPSKGSFYAHEIRGHFRGEKVTGACKQCGDVGMIDDQCTDCGTAKYARMVL